MRYGAVMRTVMVLLMTCPLLLGCERLQADDTPPPVAPVAPPAVVVRTNAQPGVELYINGVGSGLLADGRRLTLPAGPHVFEARSGSEVLGRTAQTLVGGEEVTVELNLPEPASAEPQAVAAEPSPARDTAREAARSTPTRAEVVSAMNAVASRAQRCGGQGQVGARVTFRGSDGAVQDVRLSGATPDPQRTCVIQRVREARVPPFGNDTFSISYPIRL